MANRLTENPFVIDTAGAAAIFKTNIQVEYFEFVGYNLDTDNVIVQDGAGNLIWQENGASDLRNVRSGRIGWVQGLTVPTLSAGKLLVFFR